MTSLGPSGRPGRLAPAPPTRTVAIPPPGPDIGTAGADPCREPLPASPDAPPETPVPTHRRILLRIAALAAPAVLATLGRAAEPPLRFAVGPFQPTAGDTRRAFEPFFARVAEALGRPYELTVTTDWAGIAVALLRRQPGDLVDALSAATYGAAIGGVAALVAVGASYVVSERPQRGAALPLVQAVLPFAAAAPVAFFLALQTTL